MSDLIQDAVVAIEQIEVAAGALAVACKVEMELEDKRPLVKADAVKRIMQRDGIAATPAEKIVETDADYLALRRLQTLAVVETIRARGAYEASRRRADLAVALCEVTVALGGQR